MFEQNNLYSNQHKKIFYQLNEIDKNKQINPRIDFQITVKLDFKELLNKEQIDFLRNFLLITNSFMQ